ncbi:universal stress protein [Natronoarchaeum mannanilyticum]|uniref:Universal stress protein n=1 Tax=Natronoarchaeum mannanilyticum TaxID=926360 RepID=A0AAV3TBK4_9EURY
MTDRPSILVPLRVLEGEPLEPGVVDLLSGARVVLLGYYEIPDQTAPGQARMQFEDRARNRLNDLEAQFEDADAVVESTLVFTRDGDETIERVAREEGCVATLLLNPAAAMDDVLVAVRGDRVIDRIAAVAGGLFDDGTTSVTLLNVARGDERVPEGEAFLERVRSELVDAGVDPARIEVRVETARRPIRKIVEVSAAFDAVILGESDPSVMTVLFGEKSEQVAERFIGPVLVVRQPREPEEENRPDGSTQ